MVKVAFIHNNFPAGGAERVTVDIATYLSTLNGYKVYVYASRIADSLITDDMEGIFILRQIPTQAVPSRRAQQIEQYIKEDEIDILVQVGKSIPGIEGIKERTGVKTVVACHGEPFWQRYAITYRRQKGVVRKLMWYMFNRKRYEDGSLAKRKAVFRTLKEYGGCDAYTVLCQPYKLETAAELGIDPETSHIYAIENPEYTLEEVNYDKEKVVLFCGRFENWSKRIDSLLRIWGMVQDRLPEWRLVLVGNGPDAPMLKAMAEELKLERVSFEGMQKDVGRYYDKASIVAMTSLTEGWGLALSEAQARGCIGIAFGCTAGIIEVLEPDGECGFIVPPFDEREYADTLVRIATMSEDEKMRIRRNSVVKRQRYSPDKITEKWRKLFDQITCSNESV